MNQANEPTIWWPHPSALDDLSVTETKNGFELDAPVGTECGDWLDYFNETEERREVFQEAFIQMLKDYIQLLDGQNQVQPDEQDQDRSGCQEDGSGPI